MKLISILARALDALTECLGKSLAWLCIAMMLVMALTVVLRYGFDIGSIMLQESVLYMHAALFLLASGYTLKHDSHVRVDVFYRSFSDRSKAWVNLLGTVFLLTPVMIFIIWSSWSYVETSWSIKEVSSEAGGIPAVFILKSFIPAMAILMLLQGLANILNCLLIIGDSGNSHMELGSVESSQ